MRWLKPVRATAALAAIGLVAVACTGTDNQDKSGGGPTGSNKAFHYQTILAEDIGTESYWAYYNNADVYSSYAIGSTKCSMFQTEFPSPSFIPDLATKDYSEFTPTENKDGTWSVDVTMQDGVTWSDGEPLTAEDFEFTFDAVKGLKLADNWVSAWLPVSKKSKSTGTLAVEAVNPTTVRYTFNQKPGLAVWPFAVGEAPIMAKHYWQDEVAAAKKSANPAQTITAESGKGDPSCGPVVYDDREKGSFVTVVANKKWHQTGRKVTHYEGGGAKVVHKSEGLNGVYGGEGKGKELSSYTVGPYLKKETLKVFNEPNAAILGMKEGKADFFYNSLGLQKGLRQQVAKSDNLALVSNQQNGLRYMAFNEAKMPMNDRAFRQAVATIIDKETLTSEVLGGEAYPLPTAMPPGNKAWYNEKRAEQISGRYQDFANHAKRVQAAADILKKAGYSWTTEPKVSGDKVVTPGSGLTMPNGKKMPEVELQHPTQGYDRLRYIAAKTIVKWAADVGIPLKSEPTDFQQMVTNTASPSSRPDMWILGYSFGSPVFPDHYDAFWRSDSPSNLVGYDSKEYDKWVTKYMNAPSTEVAKEILWNKVEPIRQRDVPWVILFGTPVTEVYNKESVTYPYTTSLSGIQYVDGMKAEVRAVD